MARARLRGRAGVGAHPSTPRPPAPPPARSKKRTLIAWGAVDASDARKADAAALGGPLDAVFEAQKAALRSEMVAKEGARGGMAVDRLVHKLTHVGFS